MLYNITGSIRLSDDTCVSIILICMKPDFTIGDFVDIVKKLRFDDAGIVEAEIIEIEPIEVSIH